MDRTEAFIEDCLEHAFYDPVKRRAYYLRNRVLKGRNKKTKQIPNSRRDRDGGLKRTMEQELARNKAKSQKLSEEWDKIPGRYKNRNGLVDLWKSLGDQSKVNKAMDRNRGERNLLMARNEVRLAAARKHAKTLPEKKRKAVLKKIKALENKHKKLKARHRWGLD